MNQSNIIHTDKKYLSEIMNELPTNVILNKGVTGCGGTWVELHSPRNSLILVPTKELVKNKLQPDCLGVYGKVKNSEIIKYVNSDEIKYKKIIGTYDCLKRLLIIYPHIINYFLLVDEFHLLFNAYSFRRDPILEILNRFTLFDSFCFMTATPLDENIILEELKNVPQINIKWENEVKVKINIINTSYVIKQLYKVIMEESTCNYHIFLNSVQTIKKVITKFKLENYRVVCSENHQKSNSTLKFASTKDPVCKYNFYTSAAFEGCDIYDPYGKTIVICDTNISTTVLDIATLIRQIAGRLRDSIYKDEIMLILNTESHRYAGKNKKLFEIEVEENIKKGKMLEDRFKNDPDDLYRHTQLSLYSEELWSKMYINKYNETLYYDDNLRKIDEYNFKLIEEIYKTSITVLKEASKQGFEINEVTNGLDWITSRLISGKLYLYEELEEMFFDLFMEKSITFNGHTLKNYFPPFEKIRKQENKIRKTYYKFIF